MNKTSIGILALILGAGVGALVFYLVIRNSLRVIPPGAEPQDLLRNNEAAVVIVKVKVKPHSDVKPKALKEIGPTREPSSLVLSKYYKGNVTREAYRLPIKDGVKIAGKTFDNLVILKSALDLNVDTDRYLVIELGTFSDKILEGDQFSSSLHLWAEIDATGKPNGTILLSADSDAVKAFPATKTDQLPKTDGTTLE